MFSGGGHVHMHAPHSIQPWRLLLHNLRQHTPTLIRPREKLSRSKVMCCLFNRIYTYTFSAQSKSSQSCILDISRWSGSPMAHSYVPSSWSCSNCSCCSRVAWVMPKFDIFLAFLFHFISWIIRFCGLCATLEVLLFVKYLLLQILF